MLARTRAALGCFVVALARVHAACATSYVSLDTGASDASDESLKLPLVRGIRAITLWAYVEDRQDDYYWDYLLDARKTLSWPFVPPPVPMRAGRR